MGDYSENILSLLNKKTFVKQWIKEKYKQKPIIIYGKQGIGKTTLANYILKDFIILNVNIDFCKNKTNLNDYLKLSLYKKSITMMFDKETRKKALIFDDLKYIQQYDKNLFKQIIDFSKTHHEYHIIFIFQTINHKTVKNIYKNSYIINLSLNNKQCTDIVKNYYVKDLKNIDIDSLVKKSMFNFHSIKINIDFYQGQTKSIVNIDKNYDDIFEIIDELYEKNDIDFYYKKSISEFTIIPLHILENCLEWIFKKNISYKKKYKSIIDIYYGNCISDYIYSTTNILYDWNMVNHIITNSIIIPLKILNKNNIKITCKDYNKYISRSIIYTYNIKLLNNNNLTIYILSKIFSLYKNKNYERIKEIMNYYEINENCIIKFSKYFFDKKISFKNT